MSWPTSARSTWVTWSAGVDLKGIEALTLAHEEADLVVATIAPPTVEPPADEAAAQTVVTEGGAEA